MFAHERLNAVTELLARKQKASVQYLQRVLKVSPATLRRDLAELEKTNRVVRVHGGVIHPPYLLGEPTLDQKSRRAVAAKRAIAQAASNLVPPRVNVFIDAGSTCLEIARCLIHRQDVILITNSISLLQLVGKSTAKIICLGGELRTVSEAMVGSLTLSWLKHIRADWAFIGASGLSEKDGASTTESSEAAIKQQYCQRATHCVLAADSSKWDRPALINFTPWEDFNYWITTSSIPVEKAKKIQALGPKVIRCSFED